jgi:hypothetical protein
MTDSEVGLRSTKGSYNLGYQVRRLVLFVKSEAGTVSHAVTDIAMETEPGSQVSLRSMEDALLGDWNSIPRIRQFVTFLLTGFSGVAILLAMLSTYGAVARSVASGKREIGLHLALGSTRRQVVSRAGRVSTFTTL